MKEDIYNDIYEEKEEKIDFRAIIFNYIIQWPWFIASLIICLSLAYVYLRYTTPVYNASASIIIKEDNKKGGGNIAALEDFGLLTSADNIDNEIEILHSKSLVKDVVAELGLYTTYLYRGRLSKIDLYNYSPVLVNISPQDLESLKGTVSMEIQVNPNNSVIVTGTAQGQNFNKSFTSLPDSVVTKVGTLTFIYGKNYQSSKKERMLVAELVPPMNVAKGYVGALTVEATSKTTSIANISLKNTHKQRGEDFVNKLIEMYNRNANNDKNEVARKTAIFINERVDIIKQELGMTEDELATFKQSAGLTDLVSNAQLTLSGSSEYEKKKVENGTQINLVEYLTEYISNSANINTVLPVNVGLTDESLSGLITRYNELIQERSRLLRTSSEKNPALITLNGNIQSMLANIQTTMGSVHKGLLITKRNLEHEAGKYNTRINKAPVQERRLVSISRQQEIKASLYLMLLQKREENAIALAATADNAWIIDRAMADDAPVSPKRSMIWLVALLAGLFIPITIIYLIKLLNFRITGHAEVEKLTKLPIIGDIPLAENKDEMIVVHENKNDIMAETFRGLRSNLLFTLNGDDKKVIMVTSTVSSEGKTFTASNLAVSFALLGKKVALVGLDIRKPGLNKVFSFSHKQDGITRFLSTPHETDLLSLIHQSSISPNLKVITGGIIPPNPTELLARESLAEAIDILRKNFDYIILDTAPVGMVTDTLMIARVADACVYVCRTDFSHKGNMELVNELSDSGKLPNTSIVINGVDMTKKKYGYYYGYGKYGKYYGYEKKYGYGYGYGQK